MMRSSALFWWGFIILAICLYSLPWVVSPGASLTLNGYDLAEWSSLYPGIRSGSTPLLVTFALRSPLLCISILIAFAPRSAWWLRFKVILALVGVLLPPPEFFSSNFDDPNYRQMLLLAGLALIAGALGIVYRGQRGRAVIQFAALAAMIVASSGGLLTGLSLLSEFDLPLQVGPGGVSLILLSLVFGAGLIIKRGNFAQVTSQTQAVYSPVNRPSS
jgi:hypothetical protein